MDVNKIALQRCATLLELSRKTFAEDKALARRYVSLARKIAMRHRLKLGGKAFCKRCNAPFLPGATLKVRLNPRQKIITYICLECGAKKKFGYERERAASKALSTRQAQRAAPAARPAGI